MTWRIGTARLPELDIRSDYVNNPGHNEIDIVNINIIIVHNR
jgi:hypothetical protein